MCGILESTAETRERSGHWRKGYCPNPGGRPKGLINVQELARQHTEQAIRTLVEALRDPKLKVQAAIALLDRAYGKPHVAIRTQNESTVLHLIAAQAAGDSIIEALNDKPAIDGERQPTINTTALPPLTE